MASVIARTVAGILLLLFGVSTLILVFWAYTFSQQAFSSVRSFSRAFEEERGRATQALREVSELFSGGSQEVSGSGGGPRALELAERLRGMLGDGPSGSRSEGSSRGGATQPSGGSGPLDPLERRLGQASASWNRLGEGPLPWELLGRVESAVNALLIWSGVQGLVSIAFGIFLLAWQRPVTSATTPAVLPGPPSAQPQSTLGRVPTPAAPSSQASTPRTGQWSNDDATWPGGPPPAPPSR